MQRVLAHTDFVMIYQSDFPLECKGKLTHQLTSELRPLYSPSLHFTSTLAQLPFDWCATPFPGSNMSSEEPSVKEIVLQDTASVLGVKVFQTVDPEKIPEAVPETSGPLPDIPTCITQNSIPVNLESTENSPFEIMVGLSDSVPRWAPGSVVKWTAWQMGFNSQDDAFFAAGQLAQAADEWNKRDVGVTFEYTALAKDANFALCHGGPKGTVLASAYFPNNNDLNLVYVYSYAFTPSWKNNLWKVLTHELGHVLGLRHEFAMENFQGRKPEGGAVQIGEKNELSVMNYRVEPPEIQESDVSSTKEFYKMPAGTMLSYAPIVDYTPL